MTATAGPERRAATEPLRVAIIGNPNTGKTTLFNALTGLSQRVGNFAGVTVERVEGAFRMHDGRRVAVLDLPGSYSLSAGSPDEQIALEVLRTAKPDRVLETNVEYYTAVLLEAVGFSPDAFTCVFAMGRVAGWVAHAREQQTTGRLIRPQSRYIGPDISLAA